MNLRSLRPERYSRLGNYLLLLAFLSAEYLKKGRKWGKSIQNWYSILGSAVSLYSLNLYNKLSRWSIIGINQTIGCYGCHAFGKLNGINSSAQASASSLIDVITLMLAIRKKAEPWGAPVNLGPNVSRQAKSTLKSTTLNPCPSSRSSVPAPP